MIEYLLGTKQHDIYFFNSGFTYTEDGGLIMRQVSNTISGDLKTFEIYNSPILAPVQQSILNVKHYLEDESVYALLKNFIDYFGSFDVIHFNNLEGLPLSVLKLKEIYPNTKFVYSLHNYFLVCTKVDLWQTHNGANGHNCNKDNYTECLNCYHKLNYNAEILVRRYQNIPVIRPVVDIYSRNFPDVDSPKLYQEFEERNIFNANKYFDAILAVSKRVKEIFVARGLNENKVHVSYIGTDVAAFQKRQSSADLNANIFKIVYIGYMSESKGFYFFVKSLMDMPKDIAAKISVTVAARYGNHNVAEINALQSLNGKFNEVILLNGYRRDQLKDLLADKHLGIVPVLWEDNLPQIAIEQIAYGVPVLCSDCGGVSELHNQNPNFTFKAGDVSDFLTKLTNIVNNRNLIRNYWRTAMSLTTMKKHVDFISRIYS